MKKNIFIVILVLIILGLGGYLVYDKVIDKDKKENKIEDNKIDKKYDLEDAKKLVDKYYNDLCGGNLFSLNLNDDIKFVIAYNNLKQSDISIADSNSFGNEEIKIAFPDGFRNYVKYDTILNSAKTLFGENTTIEKKDHTNTCPGFKYLNTSDKGEIFVDISQCGCGSGFINSYEVLSAKYNKNDIEIIAGYIDITANENNIFTLDGKEYNEEIPKDVLSNYIKTSDKVDKFKLIFKQENEHYYLYSLSKINK